MEYLLTDFSNFTQSNNIRDQIYQIHDKKNFVDLLLQTIKKRYEKIKSYGFHLYLPCKFNKIINKQKELIKKDIKEITKEIEYEGAKDFDINKQTNRTIQGYEILQLILFVCY